MRPDTTLTTQPAGSSLVDVLERVLDKGIVVVGDVSISIVDVELLSIKLRLLITSVDRAEEIGIDWWRSDPYFSSQARPRDEASTLGKAKTAAKVLKAAHDVFSPASDDHRPHEEAPRGLVDKVRGRLSGLREKPGRAPHEPEDDDA